MTIKYKMCSQGESCKADAGPIQPSSEFHSKSTKGAYTAMCRTCLEYSHNISNKLYGGGRHHNVQVRPNRPLIKGDPPKFTNVAEQERYWAWLKELTEESRNG